MQSRFEAQFASLPVDAVNLVYQSSKARLPSKPPESGGILYEYCRKAGLSHADITLPIVRQLGATAITALETLIGHPITRAVAPIVREPRHRSKRIDSRAISWLSDCNPKKPGTRAHRLWELYRVGMTCDEFVELGGRRSAIRHDVAHGFIKLG